MLKRIMKVVNNIICQVEEGVNVTKETFEEAKCGWMSLNLPIIAQKSNDLTYYVSNAALLKVMNISSKTPAIMAATVESGEHMILCNDAFEELIPEQVKAAFIAHEHGHIVNGDLDVKHKNPKLHMKLYVLKRFLGNKDIARQEHAADLYAQNKGHDMVRALIFMKKFPVLNHKELDKRIAYLQGNASC